MKQRGRTKSGYEELFPGEVVCIYCGSMAEVKDHALPYSKKDMAFARNRVLVPACAECNYLLTDSVQETLNNRIAEAKRRLRKKYKNRLATPEWNTAELTELGDNMRRKVLDALRIKHRVKARLDFDYFLWVDLGRLPDLLP